MQFCKVYFLIFFWTHCCVGNLRVPLTILSCNFQIKLNVYMVFYWMHEHKFDMESDLWLYFIFFFFGYAIEVLNSIHTRIICYRIRWMSKRMSVRPNQKGNQWNLLWPLILASNVMTLPVRILANVNFHSSYSHFSPIFFFFVISSLLLVGITFLRKNKTEKLKTVKKKIKKNKEK